MEYKDRLPREKMLEIVDDLAEMGVQAVTFSGGGEPLIYPYIAEAVNRLGCSRIKVATLTNGSHLHENIAEASNLMSVRHVAVCVQIMFICVSLLLESGCRLGPLLLLGSGPTNMKPM